jgi:hypothetical protein
VTGWKRASEIKDAVLFQNGCDCRDIVQGNLGDCYLLSAFSVIGDAAIKDLFNQKTVNELDWKKTGAFVIKFGGKDAEEGIVIVDDYIPINSEGKPNFATGGTDGLEIWPAILEKAYAKLYGSYSAIIGGKVHVALADLTE